MVEIEMGVACCVYEFAHFEARHLRHHLQQQGVRCDVERHAEERVSRALVELQREFAVSHVELEQAVARRQRHVVHLSRVPCRHNHASRVGMVAQLVEHVLYLVDGAALIVGPRAPLMAVHRSEVAVLVCPFVPDAHAVLLQVAHVGVAAQEPKQFVDYRLEV